MPCAFTQKIFAAALVAIGVFLSGCAVEAPQGTRTAGGASVESVRPGLGTGWGEERKSATSATSFRRSYSVPIATDRIYYNDEAGVNAISAEKIPAPMLSRAGPLSWGVRGGATYLAGGNHLGRERGREGYELVLRKVDRVVRGRHGARYSIVLRNESAHRVEAVVSVDGLDVLDGRAASYGKRGYILAPHQTITIDGFRTSENTVAAFRFSSVANSYAALRHGDTRNVGVIGLAVFDEAPDRRWAQPPNRLGDDLERRRRAEPFPGR